MGSDTSTPTSLRKTGKIRRIGSADGFWGWEFGDRLLRPSFPGILGRGHFPDLAIPRGFTPIFTPQNPKTPRFHPKISPSGVGISGGALRAPPAPLPAPKIGVKPPKIGSSLEFSSWFLRHPEKAAGTKLHQPRLWGGDFGDFGGV